MIDLDAARKALEPTQLGLEAAGFTMTLEECGGKLRLTIAAGAAACEDCLIPKSTMRLMVTDEMRTASLEPLDLDLVYPIDQRRR